MKIDDSLRNEIMPEMVYSLCRLVASRRMPQDAIVEALALGQDNKNTKMSVNKVFKFAEKSGLIRKDDADDESWVCLLDNDALVSFRAFRYAILRDAAPSEEARFGKIVQWYLSQDPEIFSIDSGEELIKGMPQDFMMNDAQNARGFIIWASALGLMQRGYAGSRRAMSIYPRIDGCISDWLYFDKPFPIQELMPVREFMQKMKDDCPLLRDTFSGNDIGRPLSNALRILEGTGWIRLRYTKDSGDVWHLKKSITRQMTNDITEIEVLK